MDGLNQRLAEGDPTAFAELYDRFADQVYHYLLTQTGSADDAADLLEESFMRLYRARTRLHGVDHIIAYVFQIVQ